MADVMGQSLWRSFIFVVIVSFFILGVGLYFLWHSILEEEKTRLIYANKIVTHSMQALFNKDEALFRIIGEQLQEKGLFDQPDASIQLINKLLRDNPELVGVGIVDLDGNIRITSSNMTNANLPNLREKQETSDSFNKALKTDSLIMGRTYFMKSQKQWIVPIRYRITDSQGKVVAVLAAGLKFEEKYSPWHSGNLDESMDISIVNSDYYFQYVSSVKLESMPKIFSEPIDQGYLSLFSTYLLEQTGLTLNDFRDGSRGIVSLTYPRPDDNMSVAAFSYDTKYKIYTFTINKISELYSKLLIPVSWLLVLLLTFNGVLFFMFKKLIKIQLNSKKELNDQLQHDNLTHLPNIRYLKDNQKLRQKKLAQSYSVIFIDLDNFKNSNDLHGHSIGDEILKKVAIRIQFFFKDCICIRQGGDEFIIFVPKDFSDNLKATCHEFLQVLKQAILINTLDFYIRASIGVATSPLDGLDMDTLMRKADIAMYEAKRNKSGVEIFSRKLDIHNARVSMISKELNSAIDRNELSLVYQPQFDARTNKIIGVEALIRWNNRSLGEVPPDEFIPIAESSGFIIEIGRFVFETTFSEFNQICYLAYDDFSSSCKDKTGFLRLSLNVSVLQITDAGFIDMLFSMINQYDCENSNIMLEITETMTINRFEEIAFTLETIKLAGIDISLDDFGTGYSSLSYLSKLPVNELKIDKSFVTGISKTSHNLTLIKSILNLGTSLNIKVMAEGVETEEQLEVLKKQGCHYFQGYYFSRALDKMELVEFLKNNK
jgi:diguanylate cyclase (GGDEF)-like protein